MAEHQRLDIASFLDRFFDEIRQEARSNPRFAERLTRALGGEVVFEDETREDVLNPYVLAATGDKARFYSAFSKLKSNQIKRLLRENNLATTFDLRGRSPDALIDLLYERAASKVAERRTFGS